MKICGIISEFNPFTNGHEYIISEVKSKYGLDCLCLTSGNFMQRGEMAMLDKFARATAAINAGANLVVEMPLVFSLSSAEYFAFGSVKILQEIGVTHLAFGVKIKDSAILENFAKIKANEPAKIKTYIKNYIKAGLDYNKSLKSAYKMAYPKLKNDIDAIFSDPNNILALEYLSAIIKLKADIKPIFISRQDGGYNQSKGVKVNNKNFLSATAIRNLVLQGKIKKTKKYLPTYSFRDLVTISAKNLSSAQDKLDTLLISKIRNMTYADLEKINDFNLSLAHLIYDNCKMYNHSKDIIDACNTKNFKESRIRRLLLLSYFDITKEKFKCMLKDKHAINVLAVNKSKKELLSKIIKNSKRKLIVSAKDKESLSETERLVVDIAQRSSNLYDICNQRQYKEDKTLFV
ncbi:MAG: nucleotidyltransferase family protein [Clostridia bacterium]|nr:nucleotidyltransferase family protein [Clostridia bacterium]